MANDIKRGKTLTGKTNYTVTIGKTTYVRTDWNNIITILTERNDELPVTNAGYGKGIYSGD